MTLRVDLKPEIEAGLITRAQAKGISLDAYVQELLEQLAGAPAAKMLSVDEWEKAFDDWVENSPDVPHLPDEALRRESLYGEINGPPCRHQCACSGSRKGPSIRQRRQKCSESFAPPW